MTRKEYSILGVTVVGHCLCHWSVLIVTGLLVTLREAFALTEFWVTALPLTGYVLMGVGAVPAGVITDRWGARTVLLIYFFSTGLACFAAGAATNAWMLAIALTALGAAVSLYHPTGLAMISHGIRQRGQALGIHGMAGSIGLAGSSFGLWMATMGSWRTAYFVVAAVAVAAGVTLWVLPIHVEQRERDVPAGPPHSSKLETSFNPKAKNIYGGLDRSVLIVLALLYGAMMFSGLNYRALMTSLPTYLTADEPGVYTGKGSSAIVLTVFVIGGIGQFLAGRFADRASAVRLYVALVATSVPMALLLAFSAGVGNLAAGAAMGLALVHFGTQPVENLLIAKHTPAHLRSMSYGFKFLLTFGVGALGAPMVGALWDATGTFAWTYVIFAAVAVIVTAIVMVLVKVIARHDEPEPAVDLPPTPPVAEQA